MKHYKEQLSAFVNHELAQGTRQTIAGHLLQCAECRAEHDRIKLGSALAATLAPEDAPDDLWRKIENSLASETGQIGIQTHFAFFGRRGAMIAAGLVAGVLAAALYFGLSRDAAPAVARHEPLVQAPPAAPPPVPVPPEIVPDQNRSIENPPADAAASPNGETKAPPAALPAARPAAPSIDKTPATKDAPARETPAPRAWSVETLAGSPLVGDSPAGEKLSIGEILETDSSSRARVQVADIGTVEVAPNSRVKLVETRSTAHRLALERGTLKAQILAPPRLFIVDTPSAAAVDLGCEYTLEVDAEGNARLHVTSGFVALENGRFESIVPAGAIALTKKGRGVGTPFAEDASDELRRALYRFDFENGGPAAIETVIEKAGLDDSITLWHLLSRVDETARAKVFDALARHVKPPHRVTRAGILRLNRPMLEAWWTAIENVWFE